MRLLAAELEATGGLRHDLSIDAAADIIWATNSSEFLRTPKLEVLSRPPPGGDARPVAEGSRDRYPQGRRQR
jgi:hypothetical protein